MSNWISDTKYYSGQGVVLLSERKADGKPKGFFPVGNCPALAIKLSTSVKDHHESMTGTRGIDARLTTETKCNLSLTLEQFDAQNLALASRGSYTTVPAATITAESIPFYFGRIFPLDNLKVSDVVVKHSSTSLTPYVDDETPWDYQLNEETGSLKFNTYTTSDALKTVGLAISSITVGTTTTITTAGNPILDVGSTVIVSGATGTDAAFFNVPQTVVSSTDTTIVTSLVSTGKVVVVTSAKVLFEGSSASVDYSHATQYRVEGLTTGVKEFFVRFEGLNTADENKPVVVEVFRMQSDPFKELALIGEDFQKFELEGMAMFDSTRTTGSKFFREILL